MEDCKVIMFSIRYYESSAVISVSAIPSILFVFLISASVFISVIVPSIPFIPASGFGS